MPKKYKTRTGKTQIMQSFRTLQRAIESDEMIGFCLACGAERGQTEPDARKYPCEVCKAEKVYGAEELIMMGLAYLDGNDGQIVIAIEKGKGAKE